MNQRQLKWIAAILLLAVLLYLPRVFPGAEGTGSVTSGDGFRYSLADPITRVDVILNESGDTIRLERATQGWTVDGWTADPPKIEDLLRVLPDLATEDLVARNPSNHPQLGVSAATGRRIEVYTEAGGPLTFLLGNRDRAGEGAFVRAPDSDPVFRLDSPATGYLGRDRDAWRPRAIVQVDTAAVREILVRRGEAEAVLRRAEGGWTVDDAPADTSATNDLLRMLPGLSASGFAADAEIPSLDFSAAEASLDVFAESVGDVTGRELVLSLRLIEDAEQGDWLVRRADGTEVYRLSAFTVRRLLPEGFFP